jgi:hypothetical protein
MFKSNLIYKQLKSLNNNIKKNLSTCIFNYNFALMRDIDNNLVNNALRSNNNEPIVNLDIANKQHDLLKNALLFTNLNVVTLKSDGFPDSVFIEDTSIIIDKTCVITTPGGLFESRKGEVKAVKEYFCDHLKDFTIHQMNTNPNARLDGGDVIFLGIIIIIIIIIDIIIDIIIIIIIIIINLIYTTNLIMY